MENQFILFWNKGGAWLLGFLPRLVVAAVIFGVGWWLSSVAVNLVRKAITRARGDAGVTTFLASLLNILLKAIIAIMAIAQLGIDVTSLIAALGTAGVAVVLAMKDSMSNVASGAQIVLTAPFHVGDYLSVPSEEAEGTVERIEMMFTTLRTFDNKEIVIPNSRLMQSTIINFTAMKTRRLDLTYSVSYSADLLAVKALLMRLCEEEPRIQKDPAPLVAVGEHGASAVSIVVRVWCEIGDYWDVYYAMQERVKLAFDEAGIQIPFPQLDIHFPEGNGGPGALK